MERYAKGFRSFGGFLLLLNLAAFFLPLTVCTQAGYQPIRWSQLSYVRALFGHTNSGEYAIALSQTQMILIVFVMVLPLLLSLLAGILGIFGNPRQKISSILSFVVLICYLIAVLRLESLWPQAKITQEYQRGAALTLNLAVSAGAAVMALLSLLATPRKVKKAEQKIPQVNEIKQQQVEAKYNIMMEKSNRKKAEEPKAYVPGNPRGVLVGLTGIYAGAEITMPPGEFIRMGRQNTNHLVFEGQKSVSRDHCKMKWNADSQTYTIYDYSSTGSFVNGSHDCLPQNLEMTLEPGCVLAIGDETNTFRLE